MYECNSAWPHAYLREKKAGHSFTIKKKNGWKRTEKKKSSEDFQKRKDTYVTNEIQLIKDHQQEREEKKKKRTTANKN